MSDLFANGSMLVPVELPESDVRFQSEFLSANRADAFFSELLINTPWRQHKVQVWGKWHLQPRLVAWYGDRGTSYSYSGSQLDPLSWSPLLSRLRSLVEDATGARYNSVLLNLYRDQNDRMGWHSDNEPELGSNPTIASISLGERRVFLLKHKIKREIRTKKIPLTHGSLLMMAGETQRNWLHAIDKESKKSGARINLTFRYIHDLERQKRDRYKGNGGN